MDEPERKAKLQEAQDRMEGIARGLLTLFDPATVAGILTGAAIGILSETKGEEAVQMWLDGLAEEWRNRPRDPKPPRDS